MDELKVLVEVKAGEINFSTFEEIKENLAQQMEIYKNAEFSEDTATIAKNEVATLNKIIKAVEDRRKEVKKQCMKPYDEFEVKTKELVKLIQEPVVLINTQISVFEEKKKAAKREAIKKAFAELVGEAADYLSLDQIYDIHWENVSYSMKQVKDAIESIVSRTVIEVDTIKAMESEATEKALIIYKRNRNISEALSYINSYEKQKADILARETKKREEEAERKRIADENRIREEERRKVVEELKEEDFPDIPSAEEEPIISQADEAFLSGSYEAEYSEELAEPFVASQTVFYKVSATDNELKEIELFLTSIGVDFERRVAL